MTMFESFAELIDLHSHIDLKEFIDSGLDVNEPDSNGSFLLIEACEQLLVDWVEIIISAGAAVNVKDTCGMTPLTQALDSSHLDKQEPFRIVKLLIESGANIEQRCIFDRTPFLLACSRGNIDITKYLVSNGVNIHATADDLGGVCDAKEFANVQSVSSEFRAYLQALYDT